MVSDEAGPGAGPGATQPLLGGVTLERPGPGDKGVEGYQRRGSA